MCTDFEDLVICQSETSGRELRGVTQSCVLPVSRSCCCLFV